MCIYIAIIYKHVSRLNNNLIVRLIVLGAMRWDTSCFLEHWI